VATELAGSPVALGSIELFTRGDTNHAGHSKMVLFPFAVHSSHFDPNTVAYVRN
jgi:hypothetical protein